MKHKLSAVRSGRYSYAAALRARAVCTGREPGRRLRWEEAHFLAAASSSGAVTVAALPSCSCWRRFSVAVSMACVLWGRPTVTERSEGAVTTRQE